MEPVDNNQFEVVPSTKSKRKIVTPCPNAYLNPGLDLLVNEDPMCNTAMEIVPVKKRKRTRSCEIAAFENSALDLGITKTAINEFLVRELENVKKNVRPFHVTVVEEAAPKVDTDTVCNIFTDVSMSESDIRIDSSTTGCSLNDISITPLEESNVDDCLLENGMEISKIDDIDSGISVLEQKSISTATVSELQNNDISAINTTNIQSKVTNQLFVNNTSNLSLSFIDRLALDSPNLSNQSLYLDDDLNESNIMEIKTITIITKKKRIIEKKLNTNPFLEPLEVNLNTTVDNPFLNTIAAKPELEYNDEVVNKPTQAQITQPHDIMPRRLFVNDTNSTISTVNESSIATDQHEYENIDGYRSESPVYENVGDEFINEAYNKQSKVLGHDVSHFSAVDIMNLNRNNQNSSNESNGSKKNKTVLKNLKKKVLKTLKKTFRSDKQEHNATLNPYEVPRKPPKQKNGPKESGIENPALNLDNSDEIEIEEIDDDEHQYETIKTLRNTRLNMNVTPLKEKVNDNIDNSHNKSNTPGKKVRFDSTLNQEKIITGNSFDYDIQSPGFDAKIDKYHDELENCINERKFLRQNM